MSFGHDRRRLRNVIRDAGRDPFEYADRRWIPNPFGKREWITRGWRGARCTSSAAADIDRHRYRDGDEHFLCDRDIVGNRDVLR